MLPIMDVAPTMADFDMIVKVILGLITTATGAGFIGAITMLLNLNNRVVTLEERCKNQKVEADNKLAAILEGFNRRFDDRTNERAHEQENLKLQITSVEKQHAQENMYMKEQLAGIKSSQDSLTSRFDKLLMCMPPSLTTGSGK